MFFRKVENYENYAALQTRGPFPSLREARETQTEAAIVLTSAFMREDMRSN